MNKIEEYLEEEPKLRECVVCYLVLVNEDGQVEQVLLGERKRSSTGLGVNRVAGIGGGFEGDETAEEALKREVYEEIGVDLTEYKEMGQVTFLFPDTPKWNQVVTVYVGTSWNGTPTESDEIAPCFFPINELPIDRMFTDNPHWVPKVLSGQKVEATFLYDNHLIVESNIKFTD